MSGGPISTVSAAPAAGSFVIGGIIQSFNIKTSNNNRGIAISPDGSQFAVSNADNHTISIYSTADGAHIRTFGGAGAEPGKFDWPQKLVYHPTSGNLLVADCSNKRVQEVRPTGEHVRFIGAGVIDAHVGGIACNGPLVAVGKHDSGKNNGVLLFDYGSGALVRSFGDWGTGVGQLGFCYGMRFTADERHVVVANGTSVGVDFKLSQFTVEGVFVKEVGRGRLQNPQDVAVAGSGDWIACDHVWNGVSVVSCGDGGVTKLWSGRTIEKDTDEWPAAIALSASGQLWMIDYFSANVHVFA